MQISEAAYLSDATKVLKTLVKTERTQGVCPVLFLHRYAIMSATPFTKIYSVFFYLRGGQKNELLLNLIFYDYPDGDGGEVESGAKEKETANAISNSDVNAGCAYTPAVVDEH